MNPPGPGSSRSPRIGDIRLCLGLFLTGLVISALTAIPLVSEVDALVRFTGAGQLTATSAAAPAPAWAIWLTNIQAALHDTANQHPQLFYGMDWLAFGHVAIALVFIGAWRDPVRNAWLFDAGLLACALVIPWALIFGELRGIPVWWRLIDCAFGILGAVPLLVAKRLTNQLSPARPA